MIDSHEIATLKRDIDNAAGDCSRLFSEARSAYAQAEACHPQDVEKVERLTTVQDALNDAQYHLDQALECVGEL